MFTRSLLSLTALAFAFSAAAALADDTESYTIAIENHKFSPAELKIPANTKVKIVVENKDKTPEEFESHDLKREKIVAGNSKITVLIGPLKPGTYKYFGEFNPATAQGVIIAE